MKLQTLRENQAVCKTQYQSSPDSALQTLQASGEIDFKNLAVLVDRPAGLIPAGLHPGGGGDGTFFCPVEIMLAGLVSCAGVTLAAVATTMQLEIRRAKVCCEGDLDFRGTLAVDRSAPVGLTAIRLQFDLDTASEESKIEKLLELTHRYCVVHRTLDSPPAVSVTWMRSN